MNGQPRSLPKSFWWAWGSLLVMVVGAFGPWVKVLDLTINGTDGGRDGWVILGVAGVAALVLLLSLRFRRRWLAAIPLLAGLAGVATTAYDISDISGLSSETLLFSNVSASAQWGIYLALAGSVSLTLASVGLLIESRRREPKAVVEALTGA